VKQVEHGHKNTPMAICLICFRKKEKRFWLRRFNPSTKDGHAKSKAHQHEDIQFMKDQIVSEHSPAAKEAMVAYWRNNSR
jgi:hypothetical protein